jgi:hypothetical protein
MATCSGVRQAVAKVLMQHDFPRNYSLGRAIGDDIDAVPRNVNLLYFHSEERKVVLCGHINGKKLNVAQNIFNQYLRA